MSSFCLGEIYEKNQSGAERLLLFYLKLRRRKPENFCEMYDAYHALGGNGMVTKMKQEIDELHIKQKGE